MEQRGPTGKHTCCPKPTSSQLISLHRSLQDGKKRESFLRCFGEANVSNATENRGYRGNHSSSALRVSSGVFVSFAVQPSLFEIRWTWVSTPTCAHKLVVKLIKNIKNNLCLPHQSLTRGSRRCPWPGGPSWVRRPAGASDPPPC